MSKPETVTTNKNKAPYGHCSKCDHVGKLKYNHMAMEWRPYFHYKEATRKCDGHKFESSTGASYV
jgi:hypothetical protein